MGTADSSFLNVGAFAKSREKNSNRITQPVVLMV